MKNKNIKIFLFSLMSVLFLCATALIFTQGAVYFLSGKKELIVNLIKEIRSGSPSMLNGVYSELPEKYPVAVLIDNKYEAMPQSGLSYADVVFEAPVEGGITRFLAIFSSAIAVDKIGPVRSIRPYFIDYANGFGAIMAHSGGSPEALDIIANNKGLKDLDLNEFGLSSYFWRSKDRIAPHNLYTSTELLDKARKLKAHDVTADFLPWKFKDDAKDIGDMDFVNINFNLSDLYDATWRYDKEMNFYRRMHGGEPKIDSGRAIVAKNIVVLETDIAIIDSLSRRRVKTMGEGSAVVFQDGKKIEGTWEKRAREDMLRFYNNDGVEIIFNRGVIWVEIVSSLEQLELAEQNPQRRT